jgi:hypothetical protein
LAASGHLPKGFAAEAALKGQWGFGVEKSNGKDTPSGHWEIAGVPVTFDWGYFPKTIPCFPQESDRCAHCAGRAPGVLGNKHASGTDIIAEFGEDHMESSRPIIYTSADSVIQIAAHEETFGLDRLYEVCQVARELSYDLNVGRVIARPFVGADARDFTRTGNRKDYSIAPPAPTLLDRLTEAGREVISIGKIGDIYAHSGTGREIKAVGNEALFEASLAAMPGLAEGGLLITNFVDFDMLYGHRRDPRGLWRGAGGLRRFVAGGSCSSAAGRSPDHHRRSRLRPDLARQRSHPRMCADPHLLARCGARELRPPRRLRRYRPDHRRSSRHSPHGRRQIVAVKKTLEIAVWVNLSWKITGVNLNPLQVLCKSAVIPLISPLFLTGDCAANSSAGSRS